MPDEEQPTGGPDPGAAPAPDHDDAGLDLARLISRQITSSLAGAARPAGSRGPGGSGPGGSGSGGSGSGGAGSRRGRRRRDAVVSGAHPDDRDPQPLAGSVRRLIGDRGWEVDLRVHGVFGRWAEIVGDAVAEHCTPESFDAGRLVVRTDSTAWATQLRLLAADVVRRLNEELGDGTVEFVDVQGPTAPSWKKGRLGVRGRGPRYTYG